LLPALAVPHEKIPAAFAEALKVPVPSMVSVTVTVAPEGEAEKPSATAHWAIALLKLVAKALAALLVI
jgi:hypothetical protein